jgi:ABC-type transport system involved in multi-copper enzyme maturation permease subunit
MSLKVLFHDELRGLYSSKAMLALLVGLPALMVIVYWASPDTSGMPLTAFTAMIASTLAGALAAVMVAVGMINEKNRKVYDLFLVRPVKAAHIMLSKFGASFLFVTLAVLLSIGVGMVTDIYRGNALTGAGLEVLARSVAMSISMIAVASAVGVVIGAAISSILVGVILVLYGGNQLVGLMALLSMRLSDNIIVQMLPSLGMCILLLVVAVQVFKRKRN